MKILYLIPDRRPAKGGIQNYLNTFITTSVKIVGDEYRVVSRAEHSKVSFMLTAWKHFLFFKPDLIIVGHVHLSPVASFIKSITNTPFWVITYGVEVWTVKSRLQLRALEAARKILAISSFTREKLSVQIRNESIELLPCAVDEERFKPDKKDPTLRKRYGISENTLILLTVSRLEASEVFRSYDQVLNVLNELKEHLQNVHYLLVGEGSDMGRVEQVVKERGLSKFVTLTGFVSDDELPCYYTLADLFILPSITEGFGIALLESLTSGTPVIAGNKDGSKEVVFDNDLGMLVDPTNSEAIMNAIVSSTKRTFSTQDIRTAVVERFGSEKFTERLTDIYSELFETENKR